MRSYFIPTLITMLFLLPLHALAQDVTDNTSSDLQKILDQIITEQNFPNGMISLTDYEYSGSYKNCAGCVDAKCSKSYKYRRKFRCTDENDNCECLSDDGKNKIAIVSCPKVLLGGNCRSSGCLEYDWYGSWTKVSDGMICSKALSIKEAAAKSTSAKKRKYSIITKLQDITFKYMRSENGSNRNLTSTVQGVVREMCPVRQNSNQISKECECYLVSDNCGNYMGKDGVIHYNAKYMDQDNHLRIDKLIDDGCTGHIGEQIHCRKPVVIDFAYGHE